uniref:Uncharacterized protein n=1 Tax=Arundo donax TaxID=35708 RepID=A0A0A9EPK8_ARUDO
MAWTLRPPIMKWSRKLSFMKCILLRKSQKEAGGDLGNKNQRMTKRQRRKRAHLICPMLLLLEIQWTNKWLWTLMISTTYRIRRKETSTHLKIQRNHQLQLVVVPLRSVSAYGELQAS